ncbi:MAG: InlB B-repeat-containing protein [Bacteroidaceae bacterium]|nr:InlB B-repeat-containing protein [Bacteroidaceae bacterium]
MKRLFFQLLLLVAALPLAAQTYWDGTADKNFPGLGTEASPYLISTPEQLAGLAARVNDDKEDFAGKYIKLTADIYLTNFDDPDQENWKEWEPIGHHYWINAKEEEEREAARDTFFFRGHFDGGGHTVYNMYYGKGLNWGDDITLDPMEWMEDWMAGIDPKDVDDLDFTPWFRGLFGFVKGSVENVTVADARLSGVNVAPVVVWVGKNAVVRNCHARNNTILTTTGVPSFFVCDNLGLIENCTSQGEGVSPAAGLVVTNAVSGVIRGCSVDVVSTAGWFGGVTYANEGLIEQTAAQVDITTDSYANGGGFTYTNGGTIRECYSAGNVKGSVTYTGGDRGWLTGKLAGFCVMNTGYIESCYSTCDMTDLSTGDAYDGHVDMAGFVITNGIEPRNQDDRPIPGYCVNCFAAGSLNYAGYNDRLAVCSFLYTYAGARVNAMAAYGEPARQIGCYWNQNGLPAVSDKKNHTWAGEPVTLAYMKSEAFVNDLNKMAYFTGTSQWEYRPDQMPVATGVRIKDQTKSFSQGDGTKANPFQVGTKTELENLAWLTNHGYDFRNEYLKQTSDIALNAPQDEWGETAPAKWQSIGIDHTLSYYETVYSDWFRGNYDGGFHEVQNMYINSSLAWQGLFGHIGGQFAKRGGQYGESDAWIEPTTIRNLGVTDVFIRSAIAGAVVGDIGYWSNIIQCWSSGKIYSVAATDQCIAGLGGKIDSHTNILNCQTSVELIPATPSAKSYSFIGEFYSMICDTIANALYTGVINGTQQIDLGFAFKDFGGSAENVFRDITVSKYEYVDKDRQLYTTEQMQSKELVNRLNAYVTSWNSKHGADMQLDYWEWREGDYPRVNPIIISPMVTVDFQGNGGTEVLPMTVVPESQVEAPSRPTKDGYVFAAWYRDEACTKFFDFKREKVTDDMTLYAKWLVDDRNDIDLTPFENEFATTYHIKTAAQLRGLVAAIAGQYDYNNRADIPPTVVMSPMDLGGKTVVLDNDIFLNDTTDWKHWGNHCYAVPWTPIGYGPHNVDNGALQFTGTFDGNGHTIYGMYIEMNAQMVDMAWCNAYGLFSRVNGGTIRNVGIAASVIDMRNHEDTPCPVDGYVYNSGITSGMLVGLFNEGTIEQTYVKGKIIPEELRWDGIEPYTFYLGGIAGDIVGASAGAVSNSFACVDIVREKNGDTKGYGLCGKEKNLFNWFTNCYSAGMTQQGNNQAGTYYNNDRVTFQSTEVSAKSTFEMKKQSTYEGWDFETVWALQPVVNDGYPCLRIFHPEIPVTPLAEITVLPTAIKNLIYTGSALTLITAGAAEGGEMQYSLDGENYSSDLPTAIEIGSYTVYYRVKGDAEHRDFAAQTLNVTISNSVDVTMSETETRTFCSDQDLDFSGVSGLKAYIVSGFNPLTGTLTLTPVTHVPAGTGLLLHGVPGSYEVPVQETYMYYTNLLKGVTEATVINPTDGIYTNFILANGSYGVGFYTVSVSDELAAGKAYLQIPTAKVPGGDSEARCFILDFENGEATAIGSTKATTPKENGVYYDLTGRRVEKPSKKGIYILNGKKIWIK